MRTSAIVAALSFVAGCAYPDALVRKQAANEFPCPEDQIVLHHSEPGWLARGCKKEAEYVVEGDRVTRSSDIRKAAFDERPPVPIDHTVKNELGGVDPDEGVTCISER
jgi:hypothetical protein